MKHRWLVVAPGTSRERRVDLEQGVTQIGRSPDAGLVLDSRNVSSLHASVVVRESAVNLIDLDSTNGTLLNGTRVSSADLHDGDSLELADVLMEFHEETVYAPVQSIGERTETWFPAAGLDVERLGDLLGVLVEQKRLSAEDAGAMVEGLSLLQGSARRLDSLYALLEHAIGASDRAQLVATILGEIAALLRLDVVGLYLSDEQRFYSWERGKLSSEERSDAVSATLLENVLRSGAPALVEHVGTDSSVLGFESLLRLKIQSVLCLPVAMHGAGPVGVLYCASRSSGELKLLEKDRLFLSACSSVSAVVLENLGHVARAASQARTEERSAQQRRYSPVIRRLRDERESLTLRLQGFRAAPLFGMEQEANTAVREFVERAARADVPVLLLGETGVGKSVLARAIHEQGRQGKPFVTVDCTTLASELVESELFGHEKGAFTGAHARKEGRIAAAGDGTVLVDEIGDLSPRLQGKLLRLIESGEYEPVGSTRVARLSARLLFATNHDLEQDVAEGTFRRDLFFRLNVLSAVVPPLRERRDMILPLAEHFLVTYAGSTGGEERTLSEAARRELVSHNWPGNVRELENAIMRALITVQSGEIGPDDLALASSSVAIGSAVQEDGERGDSLDLKRAREQLDRQYIERALVLANRNVSQAARMLNISRNSLMDLIKKYGVQ